MTGIEQIMSTHHARPIFRIQATVTTLRELSPGYFLLILHAPELAHAAQPGQFAQLRVVGQDVLDPLLARPISIHHVDTAAGDVSFIFKVVGRGTALLAAAKPGEELIVLGPVGNGFHIPDTATSLALIGGGVGMPPLYYLAETLRRTRPALGISLFYGGRTSADLLLLPEWDALGVSVYPATDDGSLGYHGLVTAVLTPQLVTIDFLAACGPRPMLQAVQGLGLAAKIPGQLSLEARMACGVGACLGCMCGTVSGGRRVCIDGPVFALDEVVFDV